MFLNFLKMSLILEIVFLYISALKYIDRLKNSINGDSYRSYCCSRLISEFENFFVLVSKIDGVALSQGTVKRTHKRIHSDFNFYLVNLLKRLKKKKMVCVLKILRLF